MTESQDERRDEISAGPAQLNSQLIDERFGLPSASGWHRYEDCAGSWQLENEARQIGQAVRGDSPEARRGSLIHAYLAGEVDEDGTEIKLNEEEQETADFLQTRAQEQAERVFTGQATQQLDEKRLFLTVNGQRVATGRFDRCIYSADGKLALIQDFKSGQSEPLAAEISPQMRLLAVLVGLALPSVKEIVVQVISVYYGVSEYRFSITDLAKAYQDVLATLRSIHDPYAPLVPSPAACHYCSAISICTAVKKLVVPITKLQISALPDGSAASELLDKVKILEGLAEQIKKYYSDRLADPSYSIPYYEMKPGNTVRKLVDPKTARARLAEYLDEDVLNKATSLGVSELETALAKALSLPKDQARARFNEILKGLLEEKENRASLRRVGTKGRVVVELP
jgi:Protein of unknown function (DUF2800)